MANTLRTVATFESGVFNLSNPKTYFINPSCFGDDLGKWFIEKFQERGAQVGDGALGQEDFGWYVNFELSGQEYCLLIGNSGGESWFTEVERSCGFWAGLFGGRYRNVPELGVFLVHAILKDAPEIQNLAWFTHKAFVRGDFNDPANEPMVP